MAKNCAEVVVEGLRKILISEQEELDEEVQRKVEMLIDELQGNHHHRRHLPRCDPDAQWLDQGFDFFKTNIFDEHPEYFAQLAEGQHPKFLVIACSDSRVSPSVVLNFKPGQAFVGRNIANMVPQYDQLRYTDFGAVIEYAIKHLEVENILIMGHSGCGGIQRLMDLPLPDPNHTHEFIDDWVNIGMPAKKKVLEEAGHLGPNELSTLCEKESVRNSMANLLTYPFVRKAVVNGSLTLRGGHYDFVNGVFEQWKMCPKSCHPH